jgi:hypothetical protein
MKLVPVNGGHFAMVSDEDFEWLSRWKWAPKSKKKPGSPIYAHRTTYKNGKRVKLSMHRAVLERALGGGEGMMGDHIDGNTLNNQRSNLRWATAAQNSANQRCRHDGWKGVFWRKDKKHWESRIKFRKKSIRLGGSKDKETAARLYDHGARILYGEYAGLNFPNDTRDVLAPYYLQRLKEVMEIAEETSCVYT